MDSVHQPLLTVFPLGFLNLNDRKTFQDVEFDSERSKSSRRKKISIAHVWI